MTTNAGARFSVVVPAHDEETVVASSLAFLTELDPGEAEVVVVANGCSDRTAEAAASVPGVRVVELARGSKPGALDAGDAAVTAFPRIYLDADVRLDAHAVRRLVDVTSTDAPVVAAPRVRFATEGRPWAVRAFYDAYRELPYVRGALVGLGVYALSEAGRRRFATFPDVTADDLFVQRLFAPHERVVVDDATFAVEVPHTLAQLIAVRTRTAYGNRQLAAEGDRFAPTTGGTARALIGRAGREPGRLPSLLTYAAVTAYARRRARGRRGGEWHRDESTRRAPVSP